MLWVEATAPLLQATITAVLIQPPQPVSCLLSFRKVPSLRKAVKQSNGHPNIVKQDAAGEFLNLAVFEMPCERKPIKTDIFYKNR